MTTARTAAATMRELPETERNEAIAASPDVIDLRGVLEEARKQRALARAYRDAFSRKPPDGVA